MRPQVRTRVISGKWGKGGTPSDLIAPSPSGLLRGEATTKEGATKREQAVEHQAWGKGRKREGNSSHECRGREASGSGHTGLSWVHMN